MPDLTAQNRRNAVMMIAAGLAVLGARAGPSRTSAPPIVVFVCEHGVAKSVVAAAHFNRLARARGIAATAISRGVSPEAALPDAVRTGLAQDGIDARDFVPSSLGEEDLRTARMIVLIGTDPNLGGRSEGVERWDDIPAVSANYGRARAAIVTHVEALLARMRD
jgi:hypothetical protein